MSFLTSTPSASTRGGSGHEQSRHEQLEPPHSPPRPKFVSGNIAIKSEPSEHQPERLWEIQGITESGLDGDGKVGRNQGQESSSLQSSGPPTFSQMLQPCPPSHSSRPQAKGKSQNSRCNHDAIMMQSCSHVGCVGGNILAEQSAVSPAEESAVSPACVSPACVLTTSYTAADSAQIMSTAKAHKWPKRPRSDNSSHDHSRHEHEGGAGQPGSVHAMLAGRASPWSASAQSPIAQDVKAKIVAGVEHCASSPFTRIVRTKKELTPDQVQALAAARRREMSPSLPDAAVPVQVV